MEEKVLFTLIIFYFIFGLEWYKMDNWNTHGAGQVFLVLFNLDVNEAHHLSC